MEQKQAEVLVGLLIAAYPQAGVEASTAEVYIGAIAGLQDAEIALASVQALIKHAKRFPSVADITEVYINTRDRVLLERAEKRGLPEGENIPAPPILDFDDGWWQQVVEFSRDWVHPTEPGVRGLPLPPKEVVAANSVAGREMRALMRARLRIDEARTPLGTVMLQWNELVSDGLDTRAVNREDLDAIHERYPRWRPGMQPAEVGA